MPGAPTLTFACFTFNLETGSIQIPEYVLSTLDVMGLSDATNGLQLSSETTMAISSYITRAFLHIERVIQT